MDGIGASPPAGRTTKWPSAVTGALLLLCSLLLPSTARAQAGSLPDAKPVEGSASRIVPISLDTVLRLAENQNPQVAIAREKVEEANASRALAQSAWLPSVEIGPTYYRHEGGISNPDGTLTRASWGSFFGGLDIKSRLDLREACFQKINAERAVCQQRGEMSRVTSETLLEAASAYIDMLAARTGEAIAIDMNKDLADLETRARRSADPKTGEPGARVEVARIEAQMKARQMVCLELRQQSARLNAKLIYLLGLDPSSTLVPVDPQLVPLELVNAALPLDDLVGQALTSGPGVHELEALLAQIHESNERARSAERFLPVVEIRAGEGIFGTGPGSSSEWDNRFDAAVQLRWNLTDLFTSRARQRILDSRTAQAHLTYQDLRAKLTAGVQESREVILGSREMIKLSQEQIETARRAHQLTTDRLTNHIPNCSYSEVMLSMQGVSAAQAAYLGILQSFDKAQLRLLVLLGRAASSPSENCQPPQPQRD